MKRIMLQRVDLQKEDKEYTQYVAQLFEEKENTTRTIQFLDKQIKILQFLLHFQ